MKINSAQKQILMVLKMKGAQPASVLAKELDMTNEGARLHLVKLASFMTSARCFWPMSQR